MALLQLFYRIGVQAARESLLAYLIVKKEDHIPSIRLNRWHCLQRGQQSMMW